MEHFEALLGQFLLPDNAARQQAEERIKALGKDPAIVPALLNLVRTSQQVPIRQLAAVLLRKRVTGLWMKMSPEMKESTKEGLLESIVREPSSLVRKAITGIVSAIAKHTVAAGEWPALLPFLMQCSQSPEEDHREVALTLFTSLTETVGDILRPHYSFLKGVFLQGLQDQQSNRVRVAALKAIGSLVEMQSDQEELMKQIPVVPILDVARYGLANGEEEAAMKAFEIFIELVESPFQVLGGSVLPIVQFAMEVAANARLDLGIRNQAAQLVGWMATWKPKALVKHHLVAPIVVGLCPLLAEAEFNPHSGEGDGEFDAAPRFTAQVMDALAQGLPTKHVLPPVMEFARVSIESHEASFREAAMVALAVVAEGCSEGMRKRVEEVLALVLRGLQDPNQRVRGAACFGMGQMAEYVQPEVTQYYKMVLPALFNALADPTPEAQEKVFYALGAFCDNLGEDIVPYLEPIMGRLLEGLHSPLHSLREMCLSAMGSAAAAAEGSFAPFAEATVTKMVPLMQLVREEDLPLRARAMELVAIVASAVGKPAALQLLAPFMEPALQSFSTEHSELREYAHGFFGSAAQILEADFVPYLARVVPAAITSCNMDDGTVVDFGESDDEAANAGVGFSSDEEEEDSENKRVRNLSVRTGVLDEKAAATQALGLYARYAANEFRPWMQEALAVAKRHAGYFHADVRLQAMTCLENLFVAAREMNSEPPGPPASPQGPAISAEAKHIYEAAMDLYLRAVAEDEDKETVAQACVSMVVLVKAGGAASLAPYLERVCDGVLEILQGDALCQQNNDESEGEADVAAAEEAEEGDHDEVLCDAACDVLPAVASLAGPAAFQPHFERIFPELMKYTRASRPPTDVTMAVACIAEVAREMGPAIGPFCQSMLPVVIRELGSEEPTNRRNAAFCAGLLCQHGAHFCTPSYAPLLMALHPLFEVGTERELAVRDNACGAVARMITAAPQALPLRQVLGVLVNALPLAEDQEEAQPVYSCLCNLVLASHPEVASVIPSLVRIFGQVATSEDVAAEVKEGCGQAISHLVYLHGPEMQPLLAALPAEQASALATCMPSSR